MTAPGGGTIADAAVEITADTRKFEPELQRKMNRAGGKAGSEFDKGFQDETKQRIPRSGEQAGSAWGDAFRNAIALKVTGSALSGLMAPLKGVGLSLGLATVGAQAAAAASGLVQLAGALAQTSGAALALPAVFATVGAVLGTLGVALSGVGDAFGAALSGDAEEFQESLEELSPAAQHVAREMRALAPTIDDVKSSVQDAFFGPLEGQLTAMGDALSGPVQSGMKQVAASAGDVAAGLADIFSEAATADVLEAVFDTAAGALDTMKPGIESVASGFRDLIGAALPAVDGLAGGLNTVLERFGAWLSKISESGQALEWIQQAFGIIKEFGALLRNLGGIVKSVFSAAAESGGDFLGTLVDLTGKLDEFLKSAEGQAALGAIFETLAEVGASMVPVFAALGDALAQIAPHAADIAIALGPGLAAAASALGSAFDAMGPGLTAVASALSDGIAAAAPGIESLAAAFGRVLDAVAPLIPVVGEFITAFGSILSDAIDTLMPALEPVIDALANDLAPVLPEIAGAFGDLFDAVQPILEPIGTLLGAALALASSGLDIFINTLAIAFEVLGAVLSPVIWLVEQIADLVAWFASLITDTDWFGMFSAIGTAIADAWNWAVEATAAAFDAIVGWVSALPGRILSWLSGLGSQLWSWASDAWNSAWNGMTSTVSSILAWVGGIPGRILSWLSGLGSQLWSWASDAWNSAWDGMKSAVGSILDWVGSLPGKIVDALGSLAGILFEAGKSIIQGFLDGLKAAWDAVVDFVSGIGDWIAENKGPLPYDRKLLVPHGLAIMQGLDEGLRAGISGVERTLHGFTHRIPQVPLQVRTRPVYEPPASPEIGAKQGHTLAASRGAGGGYRKEVHVHAPITVQSKAANPRIVAERTADRLALLAQA